MIGHVNVRCNAGRCFAATFLLVGCSRAENRVDQWLTELAATDSDALLLSSTVDSMEAAKTIETGLRKLADLRNKVVSKLQVLMASEEPEVQGAHAKKLRLVEKAFEIRVKNERDRLRDKKDVWAFLSDCYPFDRRTEDQTAIKAQPPD
jgi:hypothetical protein